MKSISVAGVLAITLFLLLLAFAASMMLTLGIILLTRPSLLTNALISAGLLLLAVTVTGAVVIAAKCFGMATVNHQQD